MNLDRRGFLKILWAWVLASWTRVSANDQIWDLIDNFNTSSWDILNLPSFQKKYDESLWYIGKEQLDYFLEYHQISHWDYDGFMSAIQNIQLKSSMAKQDWVLWPATINAFYRYLEASWNLQIAPLEIQARVRLHKILRQYPNNPRSIWNRSIKAWRISNVYSNNNNYFYGKWVWENIKWTYINEKLVNVVPQSSNYNNGNSIIIDKLRNGKYYLAMYVDWKLEVLTYVSPGKNSNRTPENRVYSVKKLDKHYISSSYPKRSSWNNGWAIMPLAYHLAWWIWWHIWNVNWNWLSKWCIRAPWFYQLEIFRILEQNWAWDFMVKTWNLY